MYKHDTDLSLNGGFDDFFRVICEFIACNMINGYKELNMPRYGLNGVYLDNKEIPGIFCVFTNCYKLKDEDVPRFNQAFLSKVGNAIGLKKDKHGRIIMLVMDGLPQKWLYTHDVWALFDC